jgi:hypothetical protein
MDSLARLSGKVVSLGRSKEPCRPLPFSLHLCELLMGRTHIIRTVSLLGSIDAEVVVAKLWSVLEAIVAIDSNAAGQFRVSLASGSDPLLEKNSLARESGRDYLATSRRNKHAKVHIYAAIGAGQSSQHCRGAVCLTRVPHVSLELFRHPPDPRAFGHAFRQCRDLDLVSDAWDVPIVGDPAVVYLIAKMESDVLRNLFETEFDDKGGNNCAALISAMSETPLRDFRLPMTRKEVGTFAAECDRLLQ